MNIEGLSLDHMRVALVVAQAGSLSAAARQFRRAQSAVSYAVMTLERQLGVLLFDRSGHRVRPLADAAPLLREMEAIIARTDELRSRAMEIRKGGAQKISVVIDENCMFDQVLDSILSFRGLNLEVGFSFVRRPIKEVIKAVLESTCSIGFAATEADLPQVEGRPVASVKFKPCASKDMMAQFKSGESLRAMTQVLCEADISRGLSKLSETVWVSDCIDIRRELICSGRFWGFMPEHIIANDGRLMLIEGHLDGFEYELPVRALVQRNSNSPVINRLFDAIA